MVRAGPGAPAPGQDLAGAARGRISAAARGRVRGRSSTGAGSGRSTRARGRIWPEHPGPGQDRVVGEAALASSVGAEHVLTDADLRAGYEVDWTGRFRGDGRRGGPAGHRGEVAAVVACVRRRRRGGRAAGRQHRPGRRRRAGRRDGEVVLSPRRLDRLEPVDDAAGQVTAGAGATLAAVQRTRGRAGWDFGVDLAARDSGDRRRHGRDQRRRHARPAPRRRCGRRCVGVEAVLGRRRGACRHLDGLVKDNTGYDLAGLLVRQRGHARRRHRGAAAAGAAAAGRPRGRAARRAPTVAAAMALLAARAARRARPGRRRARSARRAGPRRARSSALPPPLPAAAGVPAGRGRPATADALPRRWPTLAGVGDAAVAADAAGPGPAVALPRGAHRGHRRGSACRHKLDVTLPVGRAGRVRRRGARRIAAVGAGARPSVRPRRRRQPARERRRRRARRRGGRRGRARGSSPAAADHQRRARHRRPRRRWLHLDRGRRPSSPPCAPSSPPSTRPASSTRACC